MIGNYWRVERHEALSAGVRAWVLANYGVALDPAHTYVALISIFEASEAPGKVECMVTFPYSFVLAGTLGGNLETAIDTECRTRLLALKNARPLADIAKRVHWL
jgi:hypothetical protein